MCLSVCVFVYVSSVYFSEAYNKVNTTLSYFFTGEQEWGREGDRKNGETPLIVTSIRDRVVGSRI